MEVRLFPIQPPRLPILSLALLLAFAGGVLTLHAQWEWTSPQPVWWDQLSIPPGYTSAPSTSYLGVTKGNGKILGFHSVGSNRSLITSSDGQVWDLLPPPAASVSNLSFVNGEFILQAPGGILYTSTDGSAWSSLTTNAPSFNGLSYGNNIYVGVTYQGEIWTSPDKIEWTQRTASVPDAFFEGPITYANGLFVMITTVFITGTGTVHTSTDGLTWNSQTLPGGYFAGAFVEFLNGQFVAGGIGGKIFTSPEGLTWSARALPAGNWTTFSTDDWVTSSTYANGKYVAVGYKGLILTSLDGVDWHFEARPVISNLYKVIYFEDRFLAFGTSGTVIASTDGIHWQKLGSEPHPLERYSVRYLNGHFISVGYAGSIITSPDGLCWSLRQQPIDEFPSRPSYPSLYDSGYGSNSYVVVGNSGLILTSPDLINWTQRNSGTGNSLYGIAFAAGQFIAVGGSGKILTSSDGLVWTSRVSGTSSELRDVTHGAGLYVAVGSGGEIRTSPDGITWTNQTSGTSQGLQAITFAAGQFVAVGANRTILTSTDGILWTPQGPGGVGTYQGVAYGGGQFVVTDNTGTLLVSVDGTTWTPRSSGVSDLVNIAFGGNAFVASDGFLGYLYRGVLLSLASTSSKGVVPGQPVTLTASPSGTGPFTYQWNKGGTPISGATSASYSIAAFGNDDIGSYTVQVDSPVNTTTSSPALLEFFNDSDDDGISDTWETAQGFDPNSGGDIQSLDSDQDGIKDIMEIFQGSTRNSASSFFGLQDTTATANPTTQQLKTRYRRSTSQTAVTRTLQWSDDLAVGFTSSSTRGHTTISFGESVVESGPGYEVIEVTTTVIAGTPNKLFFNLLLEPEE